jgi:hypothetical protein
MTQNPAQSHHSLPLRPLLSGMIFLSCASFLLSGCSARKRPSIPWATAVQVRPTPQAHPALTSAALEDGAPELRIAFPPFPIHLIPVRTAPPRPHVSGPPAAGAETDAEKLEAPMIATQLSPQETAAAQQETNQSLTIADKNLASTRGKRLNAAQTDLASKIRGFLKDAREAAQMGDWSRARSLAKKAQVLSEELAGSL